MVDIFWNFYTYVSIKITNILESFIINTEAVRINITQGCEHISEREMETSNGRINL